MNTLYHFCPAHMVDGIRLDGLTMGKFPCFKNGGVELIPNRQWLTAEPRPDKQSWATRRILPYSRTAYRLTVNIPDGCHKKLVKATEYIKSLPECSRSVVEDWPGSDKWYIFCGRIPPKWIVGCRKMEATP